MIYKGRLVLFLKYVKKFFVLKNKNFLKIILKVFLKFLSRKICKNIYKNFENINKYGHNHSCMLSILHMETTRFDGIGSLSETCIALGLEEYEITNYSSAPPKVLQIIAHLLEKTIRKNERLLRAKSRTEVDIVTIFHGSKAPTLSVKQYIERIFTYSNCSVSCYVVAYIYMERFLQKRTGFFLTSLNVHRLLITSIMVAAKFLDDVSDNNSYYAKVGGVSTEEMNELETNFLSSLKFRLHVTAEVFEHNCQYLEKIYKKENTGLNRKAAKAIEAPTLGDRNPEGSSCLVVKSRR